MRTLRRAPIVLAGLLLAAAAGCTTSSGTGSGPSATPTPTIPPCPVGSWQSTGVAANATAAGVTLTLDGGSGVKVTVGADGKVMADFSGMQPATFSTQVAATPVKGEVSYLGTTSGMIDLSGTSSPTPSGSAGTSSGPTATPLSTGTPTSSASGKSGSWNPTGAADVSGLQVTVKLTAPIASTLIDKLKVSDITDAQKNQTGNAIDLQPILRAGTYQCQDENTLVITTSGNGPALTWTLKRA
ncbi:MAG: hypothetical protein ACM3JP_01605 [Betaproteobacteria bacterium]